MAIPLVYESCLFEDALQAAVEDYQVISREKEEQDRAKAEHNEAFAAQRAAALESGEAAPEDDREWEKIEFAPFMTKKQEFVVCLDTMG